MLMTWSFRLCSLYTLTGEYNIILGIIQISFNWEWKWILKLYICSKLENELFVTKISKQALAFAINEKPKIVWTRQILLTRKRNSVWYFRHPIGYRKFQLFIISLFHLWSNLIYLYEIVLKLFFIWWFFCRK